MNFSKFFLFISFLVLFLIPFSLAVTLGNNGVGSKGIILQHPTAKINYTSITVNHSLTSDSADYWDAYDTPSDIPEHIYWLNHSSILSGLYKKYWLNHTLEVKTLWGKWFYNQTAEANTYTNSKTNMSWNQTGYKYNYNMTIAGGGIIYYSDNEYITKNSSDAFIFNETKINLNFYNKTQANNSFIYNHTLQVKNIWGKYFNNQTLQAFLGTFLNNTIQSKTGANKSWNQTITNTKYVPYTGANARVSLGNNNFSVNGTTLFVDTKKRGVGINMNNLNASVKLNLNTGESTSSGIQIKDVGGQTASLIRLTRSDDIPLVDIRRAGTLLGSSPASCYSEIDLWGNSLNPSRICGNGAFYFGVDGATAIFRLLPYQDDIYFQNTETGGDIYFTGLNGVSLTGAINFRNTGVLNFGDSGAERIKVLANGFVGINDTNPATRLYIQGNGATEESATITIDDGSVSSRSLKINAPNAVTNAFIGTKTNHILQLGVNSLTKLVIATNGNITMSAYAGTGNDYACFNATGGLFRSDTAC